MKLKFHIVITFYLVISDFSYSKKIHNVLQHKYTINSINLSFVYISEPHSFPFVLTAETVTPIGKNVTVKVC